MENIENNNSYKCINVSIYDPSNTYFKTNANERSEVKYSYCCNTEHCEAYKNGFCFMKNGMFGMSCPYGKITHYTGYTKRAKGFYNQINEWKNKYPDIGNNLKSVNQIYEIGDYIYLPLSHLHNYENSIDKELEIYHEYLLPNKNFTKEVVKKLIIYKPFSLFGGEITDYQKKDVPRFVFELKNKYPDMYEEVKSILPDIDNYCEKITFIGKMAKAKTLNRGKVKIGTKIYDWDGECIYANENILVTIFAGKNNLVKIYPGDDFFVEICDNNTVNGLTVFR